MVDSRSRSVGNATFPMIIATALVALLAGGAVYYLWNQPDEGVARPAGPAQPALRPLFEGWDTPAAAIVFTGEQHGYLEPCGCTGMQTGGLRRRAGLFRQLREERGWSVAAFDLGGAPHPDRIGRQQERIKLETTRAALREMGYAGTGWGPEELRMMAGPLFEIYNAELGEENTSPDFVCANVRLFGEPGEVLGTPQEYLVTSLNGVEVVVTAVVGEAVWERAFPGGVGTEIDYAYEPPAEALERVLGRIEAEDTMPDIMVLLSHCDIDNSRRLAERFPQFDLVVTAGGPEDGLQEPESVGNAWLLQVGSKGKHAGVVGIYPDDPGTPLRFELVEIDADRFERSPEIHELMRTYQQRVERNYQELTQNEEPTPNGAAFVGAETCGICHTKAYAAWRETRHAQHAYQGLIDGREGETDWIWRNHDPECLCCHTTGWDPQRAVRYESGFVDESTTPELMNQQCENCHGAGSHHVELEQAVRAGSAVTEEVVSWRQELHLTKEEARTNLCVKCHDYENSPTFDSTEKPFDVWWSKVQHPGRD